MPQVCCIWLVAACCVVGGINAVLFRTFYLPIWLLWVQIISSFFCDISALLILSCSDTHLVNYLLFFIWVFVQMALISYLLIVATLLRSLQLSSNSKPFFLFLHIWTAASLFSTLYILHYSLPTWKFTTELSADSFMRVPFHLTNFLFLAPFIIIFLSLTFDTSFIMCLGVGLFGFLLFGTFWDSWI